MHVAKNVERKRISKKKMAKFLLLNSVFGPATSIQIFFLPIYRTGPRCAPNLSWFTFHFNIIGADIFLLVSFSRKFGNFYCNSKLTICQHGLRSHSFGRPNPYPASAPNGGSNRFRFIVNSANLPRPAIQSHASWYFELKLIYFLPRLFTHLVLDAIQLTLVGFSIQISS